MLLRTIAVDIAAALLATAAALLLLRYLHDPSAGWMPATAFVGGVLVGVAGRRALLSWWREVPSFLRTPALVGALAVGVLLVTLASLGGYRPEYWLLVGGRALTLAVVAAVLVLGLAALALSHRRYAAAIEAHRVREAELAEAAVAARLRALQAQMNPHFLFNTLNALSELVHDDPTEAEARIGDLAHLLRYSLQSSAEGWVPLRREWEAIERTLRIERARFGDRLTVELDLAPEAADAPIPGLLLQPLVENAVRYAIAPRPEGGRVAVVARLEGEALHLVVEDDGPGLPPEVVRSLESGGRVPSGGSGGAGGALRNVRQRLSLACPGRGTFRASDGPDGGTRIEVTIAREANG